MEAKIVGCKEAFSKEVALLKSQLEDEWEAGRRDKEERRKITKKVGGGGVHASDNLRGNETLKNVCVCFAYEGGLDSGLQEKRTGTGVDWFWTEHETPEFLLCRISGVQVQAARTYATVLKFNPNHLPVPPPVHTVSS